MFKSAEARSTCASERRRSCRSLSMGRRHRSASVRVGSSTVHMDVAVHNSSPRIDANAADRSRRVASRRAGRPPSTTGRLGEQAHQDLRDPDHQRLFDIWYGVSTRSTLAESLCVSRGPIRQALGRPAIEGLVHHLAAPGRRRPGALRTKKFIEADQARQALEMMRGCAVRWSRSTAEDLAAMESLTLGRPGTLRRVTRHAARGEHGAPSAASSSRPTRARPRSSTFSRAARSTCNRLRLFELRGDLLRSIDEHWRPSAPARTATSSVQRTSPVEHIRG